MLEHLYALAQGTEPGFRQKTVRWAISMERTRRPGTLIPLGERQFKCPELEKRLKQGRVAKSDFLADRAEIVALHVKEGLSDEQMERLSERHAFFIGLLREASEEVPELAVAANLLSDDAWLSAIRKKLEDEGARPADQVTFMFDDAFFFDRPDLQDWWRKRRGRELQATTPKKRTPTVDGGLMRCFVTGELVEPKLKHFDIRGAPLVSFDKDAFTSYGLDKGQNAAMSEHVAAAYREALNSLMKSKQNLAGATVAYWYNGKVPDLIGPSWDNDEAKAIKALGKAKDMFKGLETGDPDTLDLGRYRYYAMMLSRQTGRWMVRDWMEGPFEALVRNRMAWYDDLEVPGLPWQRWFPPGIERVVTCILPPRKPGQKYEKWIKPIGSERVALWHAAIRGDPIPHGVLSRLVMVNRDFVVSHEMEDALKDRKRNKKKLRETSRLLQVRMGLIRAYHRRKKKGGAMVSCKGLDEAHPDAAYHCGRLMAIMARLQLAALGDVSANVVQRYYAAASTTPAIVLGRLDRLSKFHLGSLSKDKPGLAVWYEDKMASICCQIRDRFPKTLDVEQQSLFALGYYHQIADRRPGDEDAEEGANEQPE